MDEPRVVKNLKEFYEIENGAFASGLYARVYRARSRKTGALYAAKCSPKRAENYNEIRLLSRIRNHFIISFKDAFSTPMNLVIIMEFAPGGDLQSLIDADIVLLEEVASRYISQLLKGLEYLHSKSIAHLDIKPQNLLLMGDFPKSGIKICDFELSRIISETGGERGILGTPDYVAPEILKYAPLTTKSDLWSTGIVAYVLLTGFSPFGGDSDTETFTSILQTEIDFPPELFEDVSMCGIDFVRALTEKRPGSRPTATLALTNDWLKPNSNSMKSRRGKSQSTIDLSHSGRTKCRADLLQKVSSAGLRKSLSKSREQLWKSKMNLSMSSEKIAAAGGGTKWASVGDFPSMSEEQGDDVEQEAKMEPELVTEEKQDTQPTFNVQVDVPPATTISQVVLKPVGIPQVTLTPAVNTAVISPNTDDPKPANMHPEKAVRTSNGDNNNTEVQKSVQELILAFSKLENSNSKANSKSNSLLEPIVENWSE